MVTTNQGLCTKKILCYQKANGKDTKEVDFPSEDKLRTEPPPCDQLEPASRSDVS